MCVMSKNESVDRISWLPEHVLHVILDKLDPLKDVGRSSVLSKTWKSVCSSYPMAPFVNLDHNLFGLKLLQSRQQPDIDEIRVNFMDFVDHQLSQLIQNKLRVHKLALYVAVSDPICFSRVDHLIELVTKLSMVEELCLFVQTQHTGWKEIDDNFVFYNIPFSVLASKGLRSLNVHGCKFSSNMSIAFSSLQHLSLLYAVIEDDDVMNLTRSCPAIETLEFDHCTFWINTLELSVFPRLKKATFLDRYDYLIDTVLDHTGLESFTYKAGARCVFAAAVYASIKELTLSYDCTISALNLFVDLTDTFPFLEEADLTLRLQYVDGGDTFKTFRAANHHLRKLSISIPNAVQVEEINISCPNLEWFKFHGCGLKQICINCPSLRQFHYVGNEIPVLPLLNASPAGMEDIYFQLGKIYDFSNLWFIQMRGLIEQMARVGRVIRLSLDYDVKMVDFVPKQYGPIEAIQQPNVHLEIKFEELMNPAALVDGLIWSTRPTTITIYSFHQHDIVKEICQKLAKRSPEKTCERSCNKCWRHHLQDFEVESSIKDEEIMCHLATFVERDPYWPYRTKSSFKLCWRK